MAALFRTLLYPPPPSVFVSIMTAVSFLAYASGGLGELRGDNIQYAKFYNWNSDQHKKKEQEKAKLPSKVGMFLLYAPAFLVAALSLALLAGSGSSRLVLFVSAVLVHFLKRMLEVLFLHKFSGEMAVDSTVIISLNYFSFALTSIYSLYLSEGVPEPGLDLKYAGVVVFFVGILGNFYHHYLLSKLRSKDGEGYKIPKGGLFGLVICPHYLFEIVGFIGMTLISQTVYTLSFTLGGTVYLIGRSHATRKWYLTKFPNFPTKVKALIPYIF